MDENLPFPLELGPGLVDLSHGQQGAHTFSTDRLTAALQSWEAISQQADRQQPTEPRRDMLGSEKLNVSSPLKTKALRMFGVKP